MKPWRWLAGLSLFVLVAILVVVNLKDSQKPLLEARDSSGMPKRFRSFPAKAVSDNHLDLSVSNACMIGSGQFSISELQEILKLTHAPVVVVDLRAEPHGFVNGNAISWEGSSDSAYLDLQPKKVEEREKRLLHQLRQKQIATLYLTDSSEQNRLLSKTSLPVPVTHVASEREIAEQLHLDYIRFCLAYHQIPTPAEVDRFVQLVKNTPKNRCLYFHCDGGGVRTTLFMVMYDMMRNANALSLNDILYRHCKIAGKILLKLPDRDAPGYNYALKLRKFLKRFYLYSQHNSDNFKTQWSDWHYFISQPNKTASL